MVTGSPGIIPARTGFTYAGNIALAVFHGSSPLARGLQPLPPGGVDGGGIIPARAGFTGTAGSTLSHREDHPRSRGVYTPTGAPRESNTGSSPLARGLPITAINPRPRAGIIPARAGFTENITARQRAHQDHPRSRGVYRRRVGRRCRAGGSSPLARGLPRVPWAFRMEERIIPARAGFTRN